MPDERQPLLQPPDCKAAVEDGALLPDAKPAASDVQPETSAVAPLDMKAIALLCFIKFCEPLSFSILLPFVNQMVRDTGVPVQDVGFYVGAIEGIMCGCFPLVPNGVHRDCPQH
jgi:hypothetical protein